jgi:hypothetical protein
VVLLGASQVDIKIAVVPVNYFFDNRIGDFVFGLVYFKHYRGIRGDA